MDHHLLIRGMGPSRPLHLRADRRIPAEGTMIAALEDAEKRRTFAEVVVWGKRGGSLFSKVQIQRRIEAGLERIAAAQRAQEEGHGR
jgi:hypothetical protein